MTTTMNGKTWLYVAGSVPLLAVYAMGLSGWYFEYPPLLMVGLFAVFAAPLAMLMMGRPGAARWNVIMLWAALGLLSLRALNLFVGPGSVDSMPTSGVVTVVAIVSAGLVWALVWTGFFRRWTSGRD